MSTTKVTGMMQTSTKGGDISSASPTVIDTDGDYFDVTGTTNFAAFTVVAGRRFTVQFDGVLTMTHHATTLDLPGGANITTAAGDVAEFFATGTNTVQCVNYTKADGTAVVAGGGAWNIIGTSVASNSASLTQTGISATYDTYVVCLSDMVPATDGAHPWFRFGDSGGIDSGGSDYTYKTETSAHNSNLYAGIGSTGAAQIAIGNAVGCTAGERYMATLFINHPGDGTGQARVLGNYVVISDTPQTGGGSIVGNRAAVLTLTQVQFLFSTGNIATGRMTLYGVAHA